MTSPPPQLFGLASVPGWEGPLQTPSLDKDMADQVFQLSLNQWDQHAYFNYTDQIASGGFQWTFNGPILTEAYRGLSDDRQVVVANVESFVSPTAVADAHNGRRYLTGAIVVDLPFAVPYVSVLRPLRSLFGGHGWRSGDKAFDKLFHVQFLRRKDDEAAEVLLPLVPLMASRDDWTFCLFGPQVLCVTHNPFASPSDVQRTLSQIEQIVGRIAQPTGPPGAQAFPPVPPGYADDPDAFERQLAGMSPEEQARLIVASGRVPSGVTEEQVAAAIRRDQK